MTYTKKGGSYENSDQLHLLETGASSSVPPLLLEHLMWKVRFLTWHPILEH